MPAICAFEDTAIKQQITQFSVRKSFQDFFQCDLILHIFNSSVDDVHALLNRQMILKWEYDSDKGIKREHLFSGKAAKIDLVEQDDRITATIQAFSASMFNSGIHPQFDSFQSEDQTVADILKQIQKTDIGFNFRKSSLRTCSKYPYPIGIQIGETVYDYVKHLLSMYGKSILWDEKNAEFIIGGNTDASIDYLPAEDVYFKVSEIQCRCMDNDFSCFNSGIFNWRQPGVDSARFFSDRRNPQENFPYNITFNTRNRFFYPGQLIKYEGNNTPQKMYLRVISVSYEWENRQDIFVNAACIAASVPPEFVPPVSLPKHEGKLLAEVIKTDGDPDRSGRVQVKILFPKEIKKKTAVWLPVVTPYHGEYAGIEFLPEPGNKVLVECLDIFQGLWAITGSLRTRHSYKTEKKASRIKTIQTSRNNIVTFESIPDPKSPEKEIITLQNRKNTIKLESERNSSTVNIFQGDLKKPVIALKTKNNNTDIEIRAQDGDIKFIAGGRIILDSAKAISLISHRSKIMLKAQEDIKIASKDEVVIDGDAIRLN